MSKKYFTAVFEIEYESDFSEMASEITRHMCSEELFHGARVTGAGWEDSMTRADMLADLCEEEGVFVPEELR